MSSPRLQEVRRGWDFQLTENRKVFEPRAPFGTEVSALQLTGLAIPRRRFFFNFFLKELIDDKIGNFLGRVEKIAEFGLTSESCEVAI